MSEVKEMIFSNVPLGFDEEKQQWKVHVCCHTCGDVKDIFCFDEEYDYEEHMEEDFPCYECWMKNEIEAFRMGLADDQGYYDDEIEQRMFEGPFPRKFVDMVLMSKTPERFQNKRCGWCHPEEPKCRPYSKTKKERSCEGYDPECERYEARSVWDLGTAVNHFVEARAKEYKARMTDQQIREMIEAMEEMGDCDFPGEVCNL